MILAVSTGASEDGLIRRDTLREGSLRIVLGARGTLLDFGVLIHIDFLQKHMSGHGTHSLLASHVQIRHGEVALDPVHLETGQTNNGLPQSVWFGMELYMKNHTLVSMRARTSLNFVA